jgi:hypothetical protein
MGGAGDSYTTSAFMRVSFTPEYEEGDEITEKGANGVVCVTYKAPDTLKRITMELAICEPDPELSALVSGGLLLRKNLGTAANPNNKSIGWAAPGVGDDPAGNGVCLEVWSHAIKDGKKAGVLPYFHWVFPYVKMRQSGDRVIENGLMANTFEGYGLGNAHFQSGPDGRWEFPVAAERPYAYARTDWAPTGLNGFYTWSDSVDGGQVYFTSAAASNPSDVNVVSASASFTANTYSIVFSEDHKINQNDIVKIENVGGAFNNPALTVGDQTGVASNTLTWSIDGATVAADILSFNVGRNAKVTVVNSAVETGLRYSAVTSLPSIGDTNVPGSVNYNDDEPIDNIVTSNENPS